MSFKRMSLRFNLDKESERMAWEYLQSSSDTKNKAIIDAINASAQQEKSMKETIRQTIRECLSAGTFVPAELSSQAEIDASDDEAALLDAMDAFMGD